MEKEMIELFIEMRPGGSLENSKIDLCDYTLGGDLFCERTLNIPRLNMPQLSAGDKSLADYFREWVKE